MALIANPGRSLELIIGATNAQVASRQYGTNMSQTGKSLGLVDVVWSGAQVNTRTYGASLLTRPKTVRPIISTLGVGLSTRSYGNQPILIKPRKVLDKQAGSGFSAPSFYWK